MYDAFLSYSHADQAIVAALQKGLHRVGRRMGQLRALRVYRDATDLTANPGLWGKLVEAMESSRYFVAVLSPSACDSEWVDREISHWLETNGPEHLLIVLVDGTLIWDEGSGAFDRERSDALPPSLRGSEVFTEEPSYVDLSGLRDDELADLRPGAFRSKVVDLAAPIHGKAKEVLDSADRRELRRFRRYRRAAVFSLVVLFVAAVAAALLAVDQRNEARDQAADARARELAALSLIEEDPDRALLLAVEAEFTTAEPTPQARAAFASAIARHGRLPALATGPGWVGHSDDVLDLAISPDGDQVVSVGGDGSVLLWDTSTGQAATDIAPDAIRDKTASSVDWSGDGRWIALGTTDGGVIVWDVVASRIAAEMPMAAAGVVALAWSPDSRHLAGADETGAVTAWESGSWTAATLIADPGIERSNRYQNDIAWSPDATRLVASGVDDKVAIIFDVAGEHPPMELVSLFDSVRAVTWSAQDNLVAIAGAGGTISVHDPGDGAFLSSFDIEGDWIDTLAFSPDGSVLGSGGHDSQVRLFATDTERQLGETLASHIGWINDIAWTRDGSMIATASTDRTIRLWEVAQALVPLELDAHNATVYDLSWSPDGTRLATVGEDGSGFLWDAATGATLLELPGPQLGAVSWSPSGTQVATGGDDGWIVVWDTESGDIVWEVEAHSAEVFAVAWSPQGDVIASAGLDGRVRRWDSTDGRELSSGGDQDEYYTVDWAPEGDRLAAGGISGDLQVWSGDSLVASYGMEDTADLRVNAVAWSPLHPRIAVGYSDSTIRVWDADSGALVHVLVGHNSKVLGLSWSPDATMLASASGDASVRLWDVESGLQLGAPLANDAWQADVVAVAWSPDGRRLASAFNVESAQLWTATSETEACRLALAAIGEEETRALLGGSALCLDPGSVPSLASLPAVLVRAGG